MPPTDERDRFVLVGIVVLAALALVYGVPIARAPLAWAGLAVPIVALYLFWRLAGPTSGSLPRSSEPLAASTPSTPPDRAISTTTSRPCPF